MKAWNSREFVEIRGDGKDGRLQLAGVGDHIEGWLFAIFAILLLSLPLLVLFGVMSFWTGWSWQASVLLYLLGACAIGGIGVRLGYDPTEAWIRHVFWADGRYTEHFEWFFIRQVKVILASHDMVVSIEKVPDGALFYLDDGQIVWAARSQHPHRMTVQLNRALDTLRKESGREAVVYEFGRGMSPQVRGKRAKALS